MRQTNATTKTGRTVATCPTKRYKTMPLYPGVDEEDEPLSSKEKPKNKSITPIDEQLNEIEDNDSVEAKRARLQEKREAKYDRQTEKQIDKELKQMEYEEKYPGRVRLRNRSKKAGSAVKRQVGNAWRHTEKVALDVAKYRKSNPPRVIPRPRGMRMAPPPSVRTSNMNREDAVSSTVERDFFGGSQQPQEKDFFGPSKLIDLIGGNNAPKKELDYIGNKDKKKNVRYY